MEVGRKKEKRKGGRKRGRKERERKEGRKEGFLSHRHSKSVPEAGLLPGSSLLAQMVKNLPAVQETWL